MLGGTAAWIIVDLHSDHLAHEKQDLTNLAFILSEEMSHEIQGIDLLQLSLIGHMRQLGIQSPESFEQEMRSFEVHQDLGSRIAGLPHIAALSLQDRNGNLINFSRSWPAPSINVRDRDFTRVLLAANAPKTFISEPSLSQTTGKWTIYFSRRFESPDGQLIGIVLSTVLTDHFEHLFSQIALDGEASLTLYRSDGMLLVRHPQVVPQIGKTFSQTGNYNRMLGALDGGIARFTSTLDNKERLVAGHTVAHYPLIVTASSTVDEVLEPWREEAAALGVVTVFLELVLAITVLLAVRHLRGYELLQAAEAAQARAEEHERGAVALQLQGQRFDIALNNMLQALLMFDHAGRLLVANQRMYGMFGMPDGALMPGMTYREVTDRVIEAGQVTAEDMDNMRGRRAGLIARNERVSTIWELASGRVFNVTHQPMDDGWLATFEDITERRRTEARMAHLAHHDALTDLPNRVLFRKRLEDALTSARRGEGLALLCLDLDQFKAVNDTLGHPVGDLLLRAVAVRLVERTRETDIVARLGGDEFAVVQSIDRPSEAAGLADRLIEMFDTPFEVAGHQIVIGTSIGIAFAPQDGVDGDELLKKADLALYRAKVDGRGICRLFHAEMDARDAGAAAARARPSQGTPRAPVRAVLSAGGGSPRRCGRGVRGAAALASSRARAGVAGQLHPARRGDRPDRPIGEWVLREACATAASWPGDIRVAVNLSAAQFKSPDLVATVAAALRDAGLPPDRLELEITETVMLQDTDATLATLHQLRALGAGIAMDDFGTGYSSLSYLRRFPFDRIKIDQSFVRELSSKRDCGAIVRAVAGAEPRLGMATTAEGVETREQLAAAYQRRLHRSPGLSVQPRRTQRGGCRTAAARSPTCCAGLSSLRCWDRSNSCSRKRA